MTASVALGGHDRSLGVDPDARQDQPERLRDRRD